MNVSANMLRSKFYVCPVCGNVIHSMGEMTISCHGVQLLPEQAELSDENHMILIERVEDEYYVQINHEMTKKHYISFVAALSSDGMQMAFDCIFNFFHYINCVYLYWSQYIRV